MSIYFLVKGWVELVEELTLQAHNLEVMGLFPTIAIVLSLPPDYFILIFFSSIPSLA